MGFVSGNPTRERAGERRVAIQQAEKNAALSTLLGNSVLSPSSNVATGLDGDTMVAVLQDGRLLSATLDDIGAVVAGSGGLSASAAMVRGLGC